MNKLKVLSLFSGIGAFEKALSNLGVDYELVGFSEIDKYATKSYCAIHNVDESLNLGDITKIDLENLPKADLITHGSPCTSFSVAGKGAGGDKGSGTQSSLMWYSVEIINKVRPKYVIWENVKNVLSKKHRHNFDLYIDTLDKLGYKSYFEVLNAKHYGVPQNRERIFVVSILDDTKYTFNFPDKTPLTKQIRDVLENEVPEKYYKDRLSDLINVSTDPIQVRQATSLGYIELESGGVCDVSYPKSKTRRGRVQERGNISPTITAAHQELIRVERTPLKFLNRNGKLSGEDYTFCVNTSHTGGLKEEYSFGVRVRQLTPLETWRLMSFSDEDYSKAVSAGISERQLYKQAGNSIVVKVLEGIFRNLLC